MANSYDPQEKALVPSEPDHVGTSSSGSTAKEQKKTPKKQKRRLSSLFSSEETMHANTPEETIAALEAKLVAQKNAHEAELRSQNLACFSQYEILKHQMEKKVDSQKLVITSLKSEVNYLTEKVTTLECAAEFDMNECLERVKKRLSVDCDLYEKFKYPTTLIKLSKLVLESATQWAEVSGASNCVDRSEEPDDARYDVHKYLSLFTIGRNCAMAAQKMNEEVKRTVERMTERYMNEKHEMADTLSCPILCTGIPFKDPVIVGSGITFERSSIEEFFRVEREKYDGAVQYRCPVTRKSVNPSDIQSNTLVKQIIERYRSDFAAKYPTRFHSSIDVDKIFYDTERIELQDDERVPEDTEYEMGDGFWYPPQQFNPHFYGCNDAGRANFSFD